jgi:hypothetical protein
VIPAAAVRLERGVCLSSRFSWGFFFGLAYFLSITLGWDLGALSGKNP